MKTVIYQYYDGETTSGNEAGRKAMEEYALRIGSEYIYEQDPYWSCLLYTSPSPRDRQKSRMPSSA